MATPSIMINLPVTGGTGVTSLNSETGDINLVAGSNITITPVGQNITIASTGGGGTPGGTSGELQYNSSGAFAGTAAAAYDGVANYLGVALDPSYMVGLQFPFQVGGGSTIAAANSSSGVINYYTSVTPPTSATATATYAQPLPDSASLTALQVDAGGNYIADGTVSLSFYVAPYFSVDGVKLYGPGSTTVSFADNNDSSNFYIQLDWASVTGATGYEIWRNGSYNGISVSFQSLDVGNVITFNDPGTGWNTLVAYPPTPNHLAYSATGNTSDYEIYDYKVPVGSVKLFSSSFKSFSFTDDNRSQHATTAATIASGPGGTYSSSNNNTHSYQIWSQYSDGGYSSSSTDRSILVSDITVGISTGFIATPNYGSGSYTATGNTFNYYIKSFKSTPAGYVFSGTASTSFTDDSSGNPFSVDLSWSAPSGGADGYILYLNGGEFSLTFSSINVGNVIIYNDNSGSWATSYPFNLGGLNPPSALSAAQNDGETGYGPADTTFNFSFNLAAYYNTPLGKIISAPSSCPASFNDNNDGSPFGIDFSWTPSSADANGTSPDGYQMWAVGSVHPLNSSLDLGNPGSFTFADQNIGWTTINYQPNGSAAYTFSYEIQLGWSAVPTATNYYIVKTAGDSGPSYPIYLNTASLSIADTDDSLWTASAVTPPMPVESATFYDIHASYSGATGSPTNYRVFRQFNGGGFSTAQDFAGTSFIDGNYSFTWNGPTSVTNTLFQATGATQRLKAYSFDSVKSIYSSAHADTSVTDDNSSRYYSVTWNVSNHPTNATAIKFIVNTTNAELTSIGSLPFVDINQSYNSNTTVTPSSTSPSFYQDNSDNLFGTNLTLKELGLQGSVSGTVNIEPAANAGSWTMTVPTTAGSNLQVLQTDGSGITRWASAAITLFTQTATGSVVNTTSETPLNSTGVGSLTLPANFLTAGRTIRVRASGYHSSVFTPTLQIKVKFGSTVLLDTTAIATHLSTNEGWNLSADITCRTTGTFGTVFAQGVYIEEGFSVFQMVNTAVTTVDTTNSQAITVTATWSTATSNDIIDCTNLTVEALN